MHPVCFNLGPLTIYWYGVCMALAFLAGLANWMRLARRDGRDPAFCSDLLFWVMLAGILGGRVAYILANTAHYRAHPGELLALWKGGLIYYGGVVGAVLAVIAFARRRRLPLLPLFDFAFTSLPLAHAIGRVGCVLYGCCFGAPAQPPWPGIVFPIRSLAWERQVELGLISPAAACLPVHPVQLYESAWNLTLYPLLLRLYWRRAPAGAVTGAYLVLYPLGRFVLEGLRGTERLHVGALSAAQSLSAALLASGLVLLFRAYRPHRA